tara:strand:+ start:2433 stop:3089 length:657 start_codon:yes stop_codon:yes gene_type:complete
MVNNNFLEYYFQHIRRLDTIALELSNYLNSSREDVFRIVNSQNSSLIRRRPYAPPRNRNNDIIMTTGVFDIQNLLPNSQRTSTSTSPTVAQILNATEMIAYNSIDSPINQSCPITMVPFTPNDTVMLIKHCKHCFNEPALMRWFSNHVTCPVCRYDIRNYSDNAPASENEIASNELNSNELTNTITEQLISNFNNLLNSNDSTHTDASGNITFTYTMP